MTSKTIKTVLFASLIAAMIVSISSVSTAFATHGDVEDGQWDHDDIDWKCLTTTLDIPREGTWTPCGWINDIESSWNSISGSDLVFDQVTSNEDFTAGAEDLGTTDYAVLNRDIGDSPTYYLSNVSLEFNTDIGSGNKWGDQVGPDWWKWWVKDFKSTTIHEFGHAIRLAHDPNVDIPYTMSAGHDFDDVYRTVSAHDEAQVAGKY